MQKNSPIGIFDSGVGGLTVAKALSEALPNEDLIYIGDTAHAPWGDKSSTTIVGYVNDICEQLLSEEVKLIVVACNTAASIASLHLSAIAKENNIFVINVIDPLISYVGEKYQNKKVGLIGTKQTISSKAYVARLKSANPEVAIATKATPLLVPLIEEGLVESPIMDLTLQHYLQDAKLQDISGLILGCTHYPIIKQQIAQLYTPGVEIIDSITHTTSMVVKFLQQYDLQNTVVKCNRSFKLLLTDDNQHFTHMAREFIGVTVPVQKLNLGKKHVAYI